MSTAVDTAFEELVASQGDAPRELHLVCGHCWPAREAGGIAVCGYRTTSPEQDPTGQRRCAKCLPWDSKSPLPCGHP